MLNMTTARAQFRAHHYHAEYKADYKGAAFLEWLDVHAGVLISEELSRGQRLTPRETRGIVRVWSKAREYRMLKLRSVYDTRPVTTTPDQIARYVSSWPDGIAPIKYAILTSSYWSTFK